MLSVLIPFITITPLSTSLATKPVPESLPTNALRNFHAISWSAHEVSPLKPIAPIAYLAVL